MNTRSITIIKLHNTAGTCVGVAVLQKKFQEKEKNAMKNPRRKNQTKMRRELGHYFFQKFRVLEGKLPALNGPFK